MLLPYTFPCLVKWNAAYLTKHLSSVQDFSARDQLPWSVRTTYSCKALQHIRCCETWLFT